ncbi:aminopeptidase P family protein [Kutzneria viridogrisea]|uniref:Xaa-Pro aminopeptidase n=2 Tax=Kutzneria TaxID=43356 RepID=W5VYT5_9PSEU|nr:aminopeptidase P family protein [Kutzneria albida]AHH93605.1 Xaa-Pro aminopeptidase 1 [Kutzneria albida DSM 43870]MBA8929011.1 Xaa-Pro aminopeptidase [Kutzneria viridogrisea]
MTDRPARRDPSKLVEASGFRASVGDGWGEAAREVRLTPGAREAAAAHRAKLSAEFPGQRIVVAAGRAPVRANDTDYDFRPDSDFSWLTGCHAEGAVLVMQPTAGGHDSVLLLRPPARPGDPEFFGSARDGELWIGPVPGLPEWGEALGLPCRPVEDLASVLRGQHPPVHVTAGVEPMLDALGLGNSTGLRSTLSELRRIKDDWEVGQLQAAVDATVLGFAEVAGELPMAIKGGGERWLQGTFDRRARTSGNAPGYSTIIAAGPHAPVLHWVRCDGEVTPEQLLLMDAGVEVNTLYTADVTRTFPVGGKFSEPQRQVYDLVLASHVAAMAEVKPGAAYRTFQATAMRVLAEGLHDWGLLPVSVDQALDPDGQHHRRYIVCGVGHFLGLDVHDCARARAEHYHDGNLEVGMALTVEPGLYFHPNDLTVPPELRGIGVRIEDDLVVTETGNRVLSDALPITADGIEQWVAGCLRG